MQDLSETTMCEISLSCDNLLCDSQGLEPQAQIDLHIKTSQGHWAFFDKTEVAERGSNPWFCKTINLRRTDDLSKDTVMRFSVYDVQEMTSDISVLLGSFELKLELMQDAERLRAALATVDNKTAGFLTIDCDIFELPSQGLMPTVRQEHLSLEVPSGKITHTRANSLPIRLASKSLRPMYGVFFKSNFVNVSETTYRFHSGLGGDIKVQEVMAEPTICFSVPHQLLEMFIEKEKELLQEVVSIGELEGIWARRQMEIVDAHLSLLKHYYCARKGLYKFHESAPGKYYKESALKGDPSLEFAPVNLHLQRMWVHNDTLKNSNFYDTITVGAFTAHAQKESQQGGLLRLVLEIKELESRQSHAHPIAPIQCIYDSVQAIKQWRSEIVRAMKELLALAKAKEPSGMFDLADTIMTKAKLMLSVWDSASVSDAINFIECESKLVKKVQKPMMLTPFKRLSCRLRDLNLNSPEPCSPEIDSIRWPIDQTRAVFGEISIGEIPTRLSDRHDTGILSKMNIDRVVRAFSQLKEFLSLEFHIITDKFKLSPTTEPTESAIAEVTAVSPVFQSTPVKIFDKMGVRFSDIFFKDSAETEQTPDAVKLGTDPMEKASTSHEADMSIYVVSEEETEENHLSMIVREQVGRKSDASKRETIAAQLDVTAMNSRLSANYYVPSEEPEPWDITEINIEASVMCLISRVNRLCGERDTIEAGPSSKSAMKQDRLRTADSASEGTKHSARRDNLEENKACPKDKGADKVKKVDASKEEVSDWAGELRPPMRKLRHTMDCFLKSMRLAHAVKRITFESPQRTRDQAALQIRRDACFSQALTAVIAGLNSWLWTEDHDIIETVLMSGLGPLCGFEGLLSLYMNEKTMWGDMVVAIEDLQTVTFSLVNTLNSETIPQVTGSRGSVVVHLPVQDSLFKKFQKAEELSFTITAVFFNIGINEKAVLADDLGETKYQDQSNRDNYFKMNMYYHKYKKIFPSSATMDRDSLRKSLAETMAILHAEVQKKCVVNEVVLQMAALATRQMHGVRLTCCKSAKDRTAMSCTLEQCRILTDEYHLSDDEFVKALNCMRSEGCRRVNTLKNTGVRKYAFNKIQTMALPPLYRPPPGTYSSGQT